ncbi:DUF2827 family protein [Burkholderia ubonensis]|uniref:DUF2827 family protein n=1 Tax=Burkholderia ubonensis TaxID=101571 RepID=UPI00075B6521|nr:DUF2827 family protein [Burkholderia ubonensis]KWC09737.1 hypothetical protein WL43_11550 [Burkholderia ubonensis]
MRIGISVTSHQGQNIWDNGLGQNVIFLARLFRQLPFVQSVLLIDVGELQASPHQLDRAGDQFCRVGMREAADLVDVIVEMAGALDTAWLDWMRARGKKVVSYWRGQPYADLVESAVFGKAGRVQRLDRCNEVWILPKDAGHASMLRVLQRCEVHEVPFIWHPCFVEQRIKEVEQWGFVYGYRADSQQDVGWRVAIFEPNISVVKHASIPMLICDEAYRADRTVIGQMHVLNALHLKDHLTMLHLANSLDLVREHRALFLGRYDIVSFMAQHADAVVSHQWDNDQNYANLDALYGNYPLIHNSPWLKEAGYYYQGFDAQRGALQLLRAVAAHKYECDNYRERAKRVFCAIDPFNQDNLNRYAQRLQDLCRHTAFSPEGRHV